MSEELLAIDIIPFVVTGTAGDNVTLPMKRVYEERRASNEMRKLGRVPVLDIVPLWTVHFNEDRDQFGYTLVMYGIEVGKERSWQYEGWLSGSLIPKPTRRNRSEMSSGAST